MSKYSYIAVSTFLLVLLTGMAFSQNDQQPTTNASDPCANLTPSDCQKVRSMLGSNAGVTGGQGSNTQSGTLPGAATEVYNENASQAETLSAQEQLRLMRMRKQQPPTEFEQMVADSVGRRLQIYGQSLFYNPPSTFAPVNHAPVPADYVLGPGDEVVIRVWGQINLTARVTVDRSGDIYLPKVGAINLAGVPYAQLEERLKTEIGRIYRNFDLTASLGRLRTIEVFVVGYAEFPGRYTVSSLSTLVNALFVSGGPSPSGSLRDIELKRGSKVVTHFDLYDLLLHGDKSKDATLQSGDVIYIPPVGPLVAVSGSVNVPAIYELKGETTLATMLADAGGLSTVASGGRITVERIEKRTTRVVEDVSLEKAKTFNVQNGDLVQVLSVVPSFNDTVTLRGNVVNPGRYPWHPGMRISDLIPNKETLLTRQYWLNQAQLVNGQATQYPIPRRVRNEQTEANGRTQTGAGQETRNARNSGNNRYNENSGNARNSGNNGYNENSGNSEYGSRSAYDEYGRANSQGGRSEETLSRTHSTVNTLTSDVRLVAPEVNWEYAVVQRTNPVNLTTSLIPFNLGKAILDHDESANIVLAPGDIVTIFSQKDISVPQDKQTRFVKVEGEVRAPGIYKIRSTDTLQSIVERAGGLTKNAYLFGMQLTRESVRKEQQKSVDELVRVMEIQLRQSNAGEANANPQEAAAIQAKSQSQEQLVNQLRQLHALGRVVLQLRPTASLISDLPPIALEDGDQVMIPSTPATVNVVGAVYNQSALLYSTGRRPQYYFDLAGKGTPMADTKHMFVLRADGTVVSRDQGNSLWAGNEFNHLQLMPGDTVVVPTKLEAGTMQRNLRDWTQIASQLAVSAASIAIIGR